MVWNIYDNSFQRGMNSTFYFEWDFLVDGPQPTFALLSNLLKSIMLFEVMPNTTLPAMSVHTVLVIGILLANLVVNLLELKTFRRSFGQNFVQSRVIGMIRLLELLFGTLSKPPQAIALQCRI